MVVGDEVELLRAFANRGPRADDGIGMPEIERAEARLGFKLPESLRRLYLKLGGASDLLNVYNVLRPLDKIAAEEGFLVFMDENQFVVSWGVPLKDCVSRDPHIWQRVNGPDPEWYAEELPLLEFLVSMLSWYREVGIIAEAGSV